MKPILLLVIVAIALVSAKPRPDDYDDEYEYQSAVLAASSPQSYYDGDSEERGARNVRGAQSDPVPTIQLGDLISAVEHTLVHSNHNLAIANATNASSFNSTESSTVIALPITLPTTTSTEPTSIDIGSVDEDETTTVEAEAATNVPHDVSDIMVIQTINSSQITPSDSSDVVRVQMQHITLFSAGTGFFPKIPSVNPDAITTSEKPKTLGDVSADSSSTSSEESNECSSSNGSNESAESSETKPIKCAKIVVSSDDAKPTESHVQKIKKAEILQEKLAEVAADPIILTQGI